MRESISVMLQYVKYSRSHLVSSRWFYTWNRIIGRGEARDKIKGGQMELRHRWTWKNSSLVQSPCLPHPICIRASHVPSGFENPILLLHSNLTSSPLTVPSSSNCICLDKATKPNAKSAYEKIPPSAWDVPPCYPIHWRQNPSSS